MRFFYKRKKMNKIYPILGFILIIFAAYWIGGRIGFEECRLKFASQNISDIQNINNIKGKINAETNHTATDVIRNSLRNKYTIQD